MKLDELSTDLLARYKKAAGEQASAADKEGGRANIQKANKRFSGIVKATNKQFANDVKKYQKEEVEQIEELSKDTLQKYVPKAIDSARTMPGSGSNREGSKKTRRHQGITSALNKLSKEEVEQLDELKIGTLTRYSTKATQSVGKEPEKTQKRVQGIYRAKAKIQAQVQARKSSKMAEEVDAPPFDKPYKNVKNKNVTDKSGAVHTPMSKAKDLARKAMRDTMTKQKTVKESLTESRRAEIIKEAMKKKKTKIAKEDQFQPEPELQDTYVKAQSTQ